jgi:hypothetical protein
MKKKQTNIKCDIEEKDNYSGGPYETWDSLTPGEIKKAIIVSILFLIISLLFLIFFSEIIGLMLLVIWIAFGFGPLAFILSRGSTRNKIYVLKMVEPGYNDWKEEEIIEQIKAIEECGYRWFEQKGMVGFKHSKTGLYLKMEGLHFYSPEKIKETYKRVWSKDDPSRIRNMEANAQKIAEAISNGATDEEIEFMVNKCFIKRKK